MIRTLGVAALACVGLVTLAYAQPIDTDEPGPSPDPRYQEPYPDNAHAQDVYVSDSEHPYRVDARIARAARRACGEALPDTMLDLTAWKLYRVCRFVAVEDAHEQLQGEPEGPPPPR